MRDIVRCGADGRRVYIVHDPAGDWSRWGPYPRGVYIESRTAEDCAALALANAPCTLVLDEARWLYPSGYHASGPAGEILTIGRHLEIALMAGSQRPALLTTTLQAAATQICFFRLHLARDLQWCAEYLPDPSPLRTMRTDEFLEWF